MIDLTKLSPAPWLIVSEPGHFFYIPEAEGYPMLLPEDEDRPRHMAALSFAAVARNAFDVLMRRPWGVYCNSWSNADGSHSFRVVDELDHPIAHGRSWADPYTALVEADRWYAAHVETTPQPEEPQC